MLPLVRPALAVVAIFELQATWNDFLTPPIYLNRQELDTMTLGLASFKDEFETQWALWMAASVVLTIPMVIVFIFAQRNLVEGVATTGLKG